MNSSTLSGLIAQRMAGGPSLRGDNPAGRIQITGGGCTMLAATSVRCGIRSAMSRFEIDHSKLLCQAHSFGGGAFRRTSRVGAPRAPDRL